MRLFRTPGCLFFFDPVEPRLQDVAHPAEGDKIEGQSPLAGRFKTLVAVASPQPHDSQRGPVPLLGMGPARHDPTNHLCRERSRTLSPADEPFRVPLKIGPMRLGPMLGQGRIMVGRVVPDMRRYPLAFIKDLNRLRRGPDFDLLVEITVGDAVLCLAKAMW